MESDSGVHTGTLQERVTSAEINSWRRGFTPQAEIWNGRMAMFGLAVAIGTLLTVHLLY